MKILNVMTNKFFLLIVLLLPELLFGQGLFESSNQTASNNQANGVNLNGYVRASAFGAGDRYDFTQTFGEVSLQTNLQHNKMLLKSDLRFRSGLQFDHAKTELEIKEAYAAYSTPKVSLLLGEKIESWGRTDGFNPTNNITPNNYFFFSANPDDQKLPNFMFKSDIKFGLAVNWVTIVIPVYRPSVYQYQLFEMGENVSFNNLVLPEISFSNVALATRINVEHSGIGFSLSWFRGHDPFYGFSLQNVDFTKGYPIITYQAAIYQKNTAGFDFTLPAGTWILRGETAFNFINNPNNNLYLPKNDLSYVVGLEHDFYGVMTLLQYIGKYTPDYTALTEPVLSDPGNPMAQLQYANEMISYETASINQKIFHQQSGINHAASLTLSKFFAYETFQIESSAYYNFTSEEMLIRPALRWKPDGNLTLTAGYNYMYGPEKSVFGYASPLMKGAFIELKASF